MPKFSADLFNVLQTLHLKKLDTSTLCQHIRISLGTNITAWLRWVSLKVPLTCQPEFTKGLSRGEWPGG